MAGTRTARLIAALVMLPLVAVAVLIAVGVQRDQTARTAAELSARLDEALMRPVVRRGPGLVVLPLRNATGQNDLDYLADGLATALRQQLAAFADLTIIGDESSRAVAEHDLDAETVARLLDVDHVLAGAIRGSGEALSIELELTRLDDEVHVLWAERWSSATSGLPLTTRAITMRVGRSMLPAEALATVRSSLPEAPSDLALNDYLHGKYLIDRYNRDEVLEGLRFLARAREAAPDFEQAIWASIAGHQRMTWIDASLAQEHEARTNDIIDEYLSRHRETALARRLRALRASNDDRPLEALQEFQQAVQLDPGSFGFDRGYILDLCKAGYLTRCLEQAQGLAREDPVSAASHTALATVYQLLGDSERMLAHGALAQRFGGDLGDYFEGEALLARGEYKAAVKALKAGLTAVGVANEWVPAYVAGLADPARADDAVAAMRRVDDASAEWLDLFYAELAALGQLDLAFEMTATLIDERYRTWDLYAWGPAMYAYRNDPRFIEVTRNIGLLDVWQTLAPPDACAGTSPEPFCAAIPPPVEAVGEGQL